MSDIINKAIEVLRRDGWTRGTYTNAAGQHCLVGALSVAYDELGKPTGEYRRARNAVDTCVLEDLTRVGLADEDDMADAMAWNDDIAAGVEDVLRILRCAGERLDRQGAPA